jgi:uncharacterized phage protein (TIGR01671 family)
MEREIRFRAWDGSKMLMMPLNTNFGISRFFGFVGETDLVMQYTGLKDKNGKEIYEGDIIEKEMSDRPHSSMKKFCKVRLEVIWDKGADDSPDYEHNNNMLKKDPSIFNCEPCFTGKEILNEKGYGCYAWSVFAECEIIGNIYENPELLEK